MAKSKTKLSLKERMKKKREELGSKGKKGNTLAIKEGTTRVRILPVGEDNDFIKEVTFFYLKHPIYSPSTFGEPCPIMDKYQDLKGTKDEDEQVLVKKLSPKQAYLMPVVVFEDDKGKKINTEDSGKLMRIPGGLYQQILDLYLDEDEWGDMTHPKDGYDIKIIRTGKTLTDTEYTVSPCKNTPLDKTYAKKVFDLDKAVRGVIDPFDVIEEKLEDFLGEDHDDDDEDDKKSKGKDKKKDKKKSKAKDDFSSSKSKKKDKEKETKKTSKVKSKDKKKSKK